MGSFLSSVTLPMAEQVSKDGMLLLATGAANADVTVKGDTISATASLTRIEGKMAALFDKRQGLCQGGRHLRQKIMTTPNGLKDAFVENCEAKKHTAEILRGMLQCRPLI